MTDLTRNKDDSALAAIAVVVQTSRVTVAQPNGPKFIRFAFAWLAVAFLTAVTGTASPSASENFRPHSFNLEKPYRASDYSFIGEAVGDRPVVALGESIHSTREMPLIRLNILRYLHEQRGMDAIAFEGSLMDAWTAQEHAYRSHERLEVRAQTFDREALFGLWQTAEMQQVISYALSTQNGPHPLYLTSFDLQPGSARVYGGSSDKSLRAFLASLRADDPQLRDDQVRSWQRALGPALGCRTILPNDESLRELEQWIATRGPLTIGRTRPAVHFATLQLVPLMMRNDLQLCKQVRAAYGSREVYQAVRDELNAQMVPALMRSSPRLVLWGHHSHLHYNSLGLATPSMGQHLKASLGDRLYTIGVFALSGNAMDSLIADSDGDSLLAVAPRNIPSDQRFSVERRLASLSDSDFFVDLHHAPPAWAEPGYSRLEVSARMPTALSRDFDGAIMLHHVTGAELDFLPPRARMAIRWTGWVLRHLWLVSSVVVALLLLLAFLLGCALRGLWRAGVRWRARGRAAS